MIYLDNAATTKPDIDILNEVSKYYNDNFFNPSALYREGVKVSSDLDKIKNYFSNIFGVGYEIVFTSCGTESNNMVLNHFSKRGNIVTTLGEHSAIYEKAKDLKNKGVDVRFAKLNDDASVNVDDLMSKIDEKTSLVSVIHINNETGAINDIENIAKIIKNKFPNVIFHSDGVQAFLKTNNKLNYVDFYSISGHKIGAIKGVGALVKKKNLHISPLIFGGGQEKGLRSGTENVFGIETMYLSVQKNLNYLQNLEKAKILKEYFISNVNDCCKVISSDNCSPYIICISCEGLKSEIILHMLEDCGVLIGTGSACSKNAHSRVLESCGFAEKVLQGVLRISFGFETTLEEVKICVEHLNNCVNRLKKVMKV